MWRCGTPWVVRSQAQRTKGPFEAGLPDPAKQLFWLAWARSGRKTQRCVFIYTVQNVCSLCSLFYFWQKNMKSKAYREQNTENVQFCCGMITANGEKQGPCTSVEAVQRHVRHLSVMWSKDLTSCWQYFWVGVMVGVGYCQWWPRQLKWLRQATLLAEAPRPKNGTVIMVTQEWHHRHQWILDFSGPTSRLNNWGDAISVSVSQEFPWVVKCYIRQGS